MQGEYGIQYNTPTTFEVSNEEKSYKNLKFLNFGFVETMQTQTTKPSTKSNSEGSNLEYVIYPTISIILNGMRMMDS